MSTEMYSFVREVDRWTEVTPCFNSISFLGMVGLRPSKREAEKNEVLREAFILLVQTEVSP